MWGCGLCTRGPTVLPHTLHTSLCKCMNLLIAAGVHVADMWHSRRVLAQARLALPGAEQETPASASWEGKGALLFHVDLAADLVRMDCVDGNHCVPA